MRIYVSIIVFALTALTGCATTSPSRSDNASTPPTAGKAPKLNSTSSMDPNVLYALLVGELALQRGQMDIALDQYSKAARRSRDLGVIERAARIADYTFAADIGVEIAQLWVEQDAKNPDARQFLATSLTRKGRTDAAVTEIEAIISLQGGEKQSYFRIASQFAREKNQDAALEVMEKLAARHPDEPSVILAQAQLAARFNRLALALEKVDATLTKKPNWADAIVLRAHVLQMQNKVDDALSAYTNALQSSSSDDFSIRMAYARLLLDLKRYDQAHAKYEALAKQQPDNPDVLYAAALLAMQAEKYSDAEKSLLKLLKLREHVFEASYYLGQIAEKNKNVDEAMDWYDQVGGGEFFLNARLRTAALLSKQGLTDEALQQLRAVRTSSPQEQMQLYLMEGDVQLDAGRSQQAFEVYDRALKDMPDSSSLLYAHAIAAEKLNRLDIAEQDLRSILKSEPNHVQALNALGYTLADRTNRYDEALAYIQRALALDPKDAAVIDSMGWVQYRLGHHNEAVDFLRRALEITNDAEIAAHLGEVLWVSGHKDEAVNVWKRAQKEAPENKAVSDAMKRFGL